MGVEYTETEVIEVNDYEKMLEKMRTLSDGNLKEIVMVSFEDYTNVALDAARAVLEERGITESIQEQTQASTNGELKLDTLLDCFKAVDYQLVENKLLKLFKETDQNLEHYRSIFKELLFMKPVVNEPILLFMAQITDDLRTGYPFDVFGVEEGQEGYFGLEMFSWPEWLGFKIIDQSKGLIINLGLDEFVALCLRKMTTLGFTEAEIEARIHEIESLGDELFQGEETLEV